MLEYYLKASEVFNTNNLSRSKQRLKNNSRDCPFLSLVPPWQLQPVPYFGKPDELCHLVDCDKKSI